MANPLSNLTLNGRVSWPFFVLAAIVVVALALRLHGINWDDGYGFHPDERDIYMRSDCMYALLTDSPHAPTCGYLNDHPEAEPGPGGLRYIFDADRSPLNPHWFPLGSILIYVLVLIRSVVELFTDIGGMDMRYAGRTLSALADVGSVLMVYVLGRRLYGTNVGLLAAGLTALAVIHVQHSHFYRPETFTVLLTLASIWAAFRMVEKKRLRDSVLLGLILGLALAPKVNVLPLLAPLALAYGFRVLDEAEGKWDEITSEMLQRVAGHAIAGAVVALAVFFVTTPYAFIDIGAFVSDVMLQTRMARNAGLFPFTVQYVDTPAFLYQVRQITVWGLGVPLGVVAWLSIPFTAVIAALERKHFRADLLLLVWIVPSLLFYESFEVRFLRYLFPLVPVMILLASRMMYWNLERARGPLLQVGSSFAVLLEGLRRRRIPAASVGSIFVVLTVVGLPAVVVTSTVVYSLAFQRVYAGEHPANQAAQWIAEEIPRNSPIVLDNHWDEFIPGLYGRNAWQFPLYERDTQQKMAELARNLSRSDYLVFYSARPYSSASRDPERFPYSNNYYRLLFSGDLGYRLHREFTNYPSLGGLVFRDEAITYSGLTDLVPETGTRSSGFTLNFGYADDNVSGYDHPRVLVFRNAGGLNELAMVRLLAPAERPRPPSESEALMLSPDQRSKQQSGGTFSEIVDRDGWTNELPVLAWLLVVELIFLLALPLALFVFRPLPDRGIILARILGLLAVCYVAWLIVSFGWMEFSRGAVYLGIATLAIASAIAVWFKGREMWQFLRAQWRLLLLGEVLFLGAFLAFVAIRYFNPDLWHPYRGGEKPMELAYLTAVFRSSSLPPYDPWFAGGYLNYYYWGYFVVASVNRVAAVLPTTAFNLAVPLFFALTFTGACSLGYNLAAGARNAGSRREGGGWSQDAKGGRLAWPPVLCGLTAGLFVAVIGNLDGIVQIVQGLWTVAASGEAWPGFDFWRSSRMIPPLNGFEPSVMGFWLPEFIPGDGGASWHITEFPFFTFLFADLHAHMMVIPFTLLALGTGLALVAGLRTGGLVWTAVCAAILAVGLGALWAINSWDYPSYVILVLALTGLAVFFARLSPRRKIVLFLGLSTGIIALSILSFWPFHQYYETFNNGLDASRWRTPVDRFLAIHGLFLFIAGTYLIVRTRRDMVTLVRSIWRSEELSPGMVWLRSLVALLLIVGLFMAVLGYWNAVLVMAFLILLVVMGWRVLASPEPARPFEAVSVAMMAMALLIVIGVDFVTVEGDIGRMNTLFKYYLEVWVFMAIASSYMLWQLVRYGLRELRWDGFDGRVAWAVILIVLLGSSLIYTFLGTRDRVADRFLDLPSTLDGTAYMAVAEHWEREVSFPLGWDLQAMEWLQDNVRGSPVVLEAHMEQYRWGGRMANYTGLPTVIGWPWHQTQQRFDYRHRIYQRADDVRLAYETTDIDTAVRLLERYDVSYVVVGDLERLNYTQEGLTKFDAMTDSGLLSKVYQNQKTSIFRVEFP